MHWFTRGIHRVTQNSDTPKLNVSLNGQYIAQGGPSLPRICLTFSSLEDSTASVYSSHPLQNG